MTSRFDQRDVCAGNRRCRKLACHESLSAGANWVRGWECHRWWHTIPRVVGKELSSRGVWRRSVNVSAGDGAHGR